MASRRFAAVGTNIVPFTPSTALVTDGPFALSRNPMYFGMTSALAGVALLLNTALPWLVVIWFWLLMRQRYVLREERQMEQTFGAEFDAYRARVRRWI